MGTRSTGMPISRRSSLSRAKARWYAVSPVGYPSTFSAISAAVSGLTVSRSAAVRARRRSSFPAVFTTSEGVDEVVLDHPVALAVELERVALQGGQAVLPHLEGPLLERRQSLRIRVPQGATEVLALDFERAQLPPVGQPHPASARHVVADLAD